MYNFTLKYFASYGRICRYGEKPTMRMCTRTSFNDSHRYFMPVAIIQLVNMEALWSFCSTHTLLSFTKYGSGSERMGLYGWRERLWLSSALCIGDSFAQTGRLVAEGFVKDCICCHRSRNRVVITPVFPHMPYRETSSSYYRFYLDDDRGAENGETASGSLVDLSGILISNSETLRGEMMFLEAFLRKIYGPISYFKWRQTDRQKTLNYLNNLKIPQH